jgi:dolichol kinase
VYVFGYWYLPKSVIVCSLVIIIIIVVLCEYLRFTISGFNNFFKNSFKGFYRLEEVDKISGLIGTLLGALLTILMFSNRYIVFASLLYFSFGDAAAALIGKVFGRYKTFAGKSLEGSLACFIVCIISGLFLFNIKFVLIGAFVATLVEAVPWKINDNFWMQIINAGILTMLSDIMVYAK